MVRGVSQNQLPFKGISLCLCCRIARDCVLLDTNHFPQVAVVLILSTLAETTLASGVVSSGVAFLRQWP